MSSGKLKMILRRVRKFFRRVIKFMLVIHHSGGPVLNGWLLQNRWVKCLMKLSCMNVSLALSEEVIVLLILWLICSSPYTFYSVEDIQDADGLWFMVI